MHTCKHAVIHIPASRVIYFCGGGVKYTSPNHHISLLQVVMLQTNCTWTITGATIPTLQHAWQVDYTKWTKPMRVLLAAGIDDLLKGGTMATLTNSILSSRTPLTTRTTTTQASGTSWWWPPCSTPQNWIGSLMLGRLPQVTSIGQTRLPPLITGL